MLSWERDASPDNFKIELKMSAAVTRQWNTSNVEPSNRGAWGTYWSSSF
jgi:hypothetical protein